MWKHLWQRLWRRLSRTASSRRATWEKRWAQVDPMSWNLEAVSRNYVDAWERGWIRPGDRGLDLGCGLGHSAAWLAEKGVSVLAVDFAQVAIDKARTLHRTSLPLEFRQLDVTEPGDQLGQFDVILDRGCLHGMSSRAGYYRNLNLWLKTGGRFLLQHHLKKYSIQSLRQELLGSLPPSCNLISEKSIEMIENSNSTSVPGVFLVIQKSDVSS
ncbi:MAG: class I SAM-dependent methyltransferase [Planctomycetota bacterium]